LLFLSCTFSAQGPRDGISCGADLLDNQHLSQTAPLNVVCIFLTCPLQGLEPRTRLWHPSQTTLLASGGPAIHCSRHSEQLPTGPMPHRVVNIIGWHSADLKVHCLGE
jgi:hypothetical protein